MKGGAEEAFIEGKVSPISFWHEYPPRKGETF
jgi:hypothetical protein